jgi:hypothetical protein
MMISIERIMDIVNKHRRINGFSNNIIFFLIS